MVMADKQYIKKTMTLGEIVEKFPITVEIMMKYGLHCIGCHLAVTETLEQGAKGHGMDDEEIDNMVEEMNEKIRSETEEDYSEFSEEGHEEEE